MNTRTVAVTLIGPGGAGKSTVGALLAERLGIAFVDLDRCFSTRAGDISAYIDRNGYDAYARENVETYLVLSHGGSAPQVVAMSSGFMTYPTHIHPAYPGLRREIGESPSTFVLLPSLDLGTCVAETVRRQLGRPFTRTADREAAVIRERFALYAGLGARKVETMRSPAAVVDELLAALYRSSDPSWARV